MPPRRRSQSDYYAVRVRFNDTFTAEIRSLDERISLGTFLTAMEVAYTYDATTWRLGPARADKLWRLPQHAAGDKHGADVAPHHRLHRCRAMFASSRTGTSTPKRSDTRATRVKSQRRSDIG